MKALMEKEMTELLAQYSIDGEVAQEVLQSAEKAANDLAASSGKSAECAMETVLEATKFQLELLAEHSEVQAVIVGDDGLLKEIQEVHQVGRNVCEVVQTFTPNEERQVKALKIAMKAEARIEAEEAMRKGR